MIDDTQGSEAPAEEADRLAEFPRDAKPWLDMIADAERVFGAYNDKCDSIDKLYANLEELAKVKDDREFKIFWANLEVLKPSMYARPPAPVVVPRFKDMDELPRKAAEVLERTLATTFDMEDIDATMRAVRDDLATNARGVPWIRYYAAGEDEGSFYERVCFDHVERRDFLHGPARKWREVPWVARRSWLTLEECRKRFGDEIAVQCTYETPDDTSCGEQSKERKAQVWELWHKAKNVVVWVSPGCKQTLLDVKEPILDLENFFPCPRPAYGTLQRGSLIPVPDFLYYKDQIEEINELTARISALCESLRMKGFYAQGQETLTDAIEKAIKQQDNAALLIPVPSFALMQGQSIKDAIVWLPVVEIAQVVRELIANRKQLIEDVYQITGLSDIMRGATEASETATAQRIKQQYGSVRIRDRQNELIRIARDLTRMAAEVIAENFQAPTILTLSQVKLPSAADMAPPMAPALPAPMQPPMPPQAGPMPGPMPPQGAPMAPQQPPGPPPVTFEAVMELLRSQRARPFILDIETDSTIQPDEDAEKQRATEFIAAIGGYMQQTIPLVQMMPPSVDFVGEGLKFVASKYRAGREMMGTIDKFVDDMKQMAQAPKPPPPEVMKTQHDMAMEQQRLQMEGQIKAKEAELKQAEIAQKQAMAQADLQLQQQTAQAKLKLESDVAMLKMQLEAQKTQHEMALKSQAQEHDHALRKEKQAADIRMGRDKQVLDYRAKGVKQRPAPAALGDESETAVDPMAEIEDFETKVDHIEQTMQALVEGVGQVAQMVAQMQAAHDAPRQIVRDAQGNAIGVQHGDKVKQIVRDGSGRVTGLN